MIIVFQNCLSQMNLDSADKPKEQVAAYTDGNCWHEVIKEVEQKTKDKLGKSWTWEEILTEKFMNSVDSLEGVLIVASKSLMPDIKNNLLAMRFFPQGESQSEVYFVR